MKIIAFQGVSGAYSELAARAHFGSRKIKTLPLTDFPKVFLQVESGKADYGMIPIENSSAGSIHQNYDLLQERKVSICGERYLKIEHCLLAPEGASLKNIRSVYSHPQALAQCASYLRKKSNVVVKPYFDTAGSACKVAEDGNPTQAAIASRFAATRYGLQILDENIQDHEYNYTRFLLIRKASGKDWGRSKKDSDYKTSIVFALKNIPGCLYKCLSIFAIRDIDLLKIESRPIAGSPWQYLFYLDFAGPADSKALSHLTEITEYLKVLGSYQAGILEPAT